MLSRVLTPALIVLASVAALVATTGPAGAETVTTRDATGDVVVWDSATQTTRTGTTKIDILRVRTRYENGSLVVRTKFADLTTRNTTISARVSSLHEYRFNTDPDRRGYEYLIDDARSTNLSENLYRIRKGADRRFSCPGMSWRANLDTDVSTLVVPRRCVREGERRVVSTRFAIQQTGPGRTPTGEDGIYNVDTMNDNVVTGLVRHSFTG